MASEDDLDAFFDEVEEVEQEARNQSDETEKTDIPASRKNQGEPTEEQDDQRPAKKARTDVVISENKSSTVPVPVPVPVPVTGGSRGTVVVSKKAVTTVSAAATISAPPKKKDEIYQITVPERLNPPPPPPPQPPLPHGAMSTYSHHHGQNAHYGGTISTTSGKTAIRMAAGKTWTDATLSDFPENDFRLFVGNLAKEVTEEILADTFRSKYESFAMARIIYDKISGESKGYGFVSVMDPKDCARAIREMDQSWLGARPIKVKRSDWKERDLREVRKTKKKKNRRR